MSKKYTAPVSFALFQIRMVEDCVLNSEVRFHLRGNKRTRFQRLKTRFRNQLRHIISSGSGSGSGN